MKSNKLIYGFAVQVSQVVIHVLIGCQASKGVGLTISNIFTNKGSTYRGLAELTRAQVRPTSFLLVANQINHCMWRTVSSWYSQSNTMSCVQVNDNLMLLSSKC